MLVKGATGGFVALGRHYWTYPDSKVHGDSMGPIWGRQDPGGPRVGPMNFAIWVTLSTLRMTLMVWWCTAGFISTCVPRLVCAAPFSITSKVPPSSAFLIYEPILLGTKREFQGMRWSSHTVMLAFLLEEELKSNIGLQLLNSILGHN